MPESMWRVGICICKLLNFCNLSNQTAISTIRLQSSQSMNRFYPVVHIGVHIPECVKHPAHCLRLQFQQLSTAIKLQSQQSDYNLSNQNKTPSNMPDTLLGAGMCICKLRNFCNLSNQTAISAIWLQSQQSDCNLSNQTAISAIRIKHVATWLSPCAGLWHHM